MNRQSLPSLCLGILLLAPTPLLSADAKPDTAATNAGAGPDANPVAAALGIVRDPPDVVEVTDCIKSNVPEQSSVQLVEFTSYDRIGGDRVSRAKIFAKKLEMNAQRRVLMRFTRPLEIRGSAFLAIEMDAGSPDMFLYTTAIRKVKRVTGQSGGASLFGTDLSYEDFAQWQGLNQPSEKRRLPDETIAEREVYVIESVPAPNADSSYERVVSFIDKQTCVALKTESFEKGDTPRKVLTAEPESLIEEGGIWFATEVLMRDLRDETRTVVLVEDVEVDRAIKDREFSVSELGKRR